MEEIEIKTKTTAEDFKRALLSHSRIKIIGLAIVTAAFFLFIIVGIFLLALSKKNNTSPALFFPILFPALLFAFLLFSSFRTITKQSQQLEENSEETAYIFDEQGFLAESASSSVKTLWSKIYKVTENKTDFLIFPQKNLFFPIPKRFFESENQINIFRTIIQKQLGENAKLLK